MTWRRAAIWVLKQPMAGAERRGRNEEEQTATRRAGVHVCKHTVHSTYKSFMSIYNYQASPFRDMITLHSLPINTIQLYMWNKLHNIYSIHSQLSRMWWCYCSVVKTHETLNHKLECQICHTFQSNDYEFYFLIYNNIHIYTSVSVSDLNWIVYLYKN